jgi:hypothetical protein
MGCWYPLQVRSRSVIEVGATYPQGLMQGLFNPPADMRHVLAVRFAEFCRTGTVGSAVTTRQYEIIFQISGGRCGLISSSSVVLWKHFFQYSSASFIRPMR